MSNKRKSSRNICKIFDCKNYDPKTVALCSWHYDRVPENKEKAKLRNKKPEVREKRLIANKQPKRQRYRKDWGLKKNYNLSIEEFENLLKSQNNECVICSEKLIKPHVDHCHITEVVRGILCRPCNQGIGFLKDNIEILKNAILYLEKHIIIDKNKTDIELIFNLESKNDQIIAPF